MRAQHVLSSDNSTVKSFAKNPFVLKWQSMVYSSFQITHIWKVAWQTELWILVYFVRIRILSFCQIQILILLSFKFGSWIRIQFCRRMGHGTSFPQVLAPTFFFRGRIWIRICWMLTRIRNFAIANCNIVNANKHYRFCKHFAETIFQGLMDF